MKGKFLILSFAALAFAACAEKDGHTPDKGEMETSYVAVTVKSTDALTRTDDGFDEGTADEQKVNNAIAFFFAEDGSPYPVNSAVANGTQTGDKNYVNFTPGASSDNTETGNVSDIKNSVLVISRYTGDYPAKMVVVLNWNYSDKAISLDELADKVIDIKNGDAFVMSNSVYLDGTNAEINATPIVEANISKTEGGAKSSPVTVYVERLAAKVSIKLNGATNNIYDTGIDVGTDDVYVKVLGWDLYNDFPTSYLLKDIEPTWTDDDLGINAWNTSLNFRSYWARSASKGSFTDSFNWADMNNALGGSAYSGENTYADADDRTKLLIKAQFVTDNTGTTPLEVATWMGVRYAGESYLLTAVANSLATTLFFDESGTKTKVTPADLKCEPIADSYKVKFILSPDGEDKTWYSKDASDTYTSLTDDQVNNLLAGLNQASVYNDGMTYYYTDIKHLGSEGKPGEFGIVRNHAYQINITGITGLGTPVYIPTSNIVTPPVSPADEESYVASEVRILSWKIVSQDVTLQ